MKNQFDLKCLFTNGIPTEQSTVFRKCSNVQVHGDNISSHHIPSNDFRKCNGYGFGASGYPDGGGSSAGVVYDQYEMNPDFEKLRYTNRRSSPKLFFSMNTQESIGIGFYNPRGLQRLTIRR